MKGQNANNTAFPLNGEQWQDRIEYGSSGKSIRGLTKREMFAMHALQGILSNPANSDLNAIGKREFIAANFAAREAIIYADELLKQLEE